MRSSLLPMHVWKLRQEANRERLGHETAVAVPGARVGGFSVCVFLVQRKRSRGAGTGTLLAAAKAYSFFSGKLFIEGRGWHSRMSGCAFVLRRNAGLSPQDPSCRSLFNARLPALRAFDRRQPLTMAAPSPAPLPTRLFFWPEKRSFRGEIPPPARATRPHANQSSAG